MPNFNLKRYTSLAVTPSIPLAAATREILDAIHTRATVLTGVVDTVIYVCKDIKTIFRFFQKWTTTSTKDNKSILCKFTYFPAESASKHLFNVSKNVKNLTCLATIAFKPLITPARVIVYTIYT